MYNIAYPIQLEKGKPVKASKRDVIRSSLFIAFSWLKHRRFFNEFYGSLLEHLLEEPNDEVVEDLAVEFIIKAVTYTELPIELVSVNIIRYYGKIGIQLKYIILEEDLEDVLEYLIINT